MRILLDTCTFLWLALDPERLSKTAIEMIDDERNELLLSDVSTLEIVMKYRAGKLPLPAEPPKWIPTRRDFFQLKSLPINEDVLFKSGQLPYTHKDPFDRLMAAHAIVSGATLLSPDTPLSDLGASRIW